MSNVFDSARIENIRRTIAMQPRQVPFADDLHEALRHIEDLQKQAQSLQEQLDNLNVMFRGEVKMREQAEREAQELRKRVQTMHDEQMRCDDSRVRQLGECHLMISRNTSEFQIDKEWEQTSLPPRLQAVMRRADKAEARLKAVLEALNDEREQPSARINRVRQLAAEGGK